MLRSSYQYVILAAVALFLCLAAFFMANVEMPEWTHLASAASVVVFAMPALWAAKMWLGWRDSTILFVIFGVYALLVETAAINTGFPYGHFGYSHHLGFKLFGVVPWTVAFAWTPLLLGAYALVANLTESRPMRIVLTALVLVLFDLVLDPGAVRLGFWRYAEGGAFYQVPLSNFAGWIASGFVGAALLDFVISRFTPLLPVPVQLASSAVLIIFFWTAFAFFAGMAVPGLIGVGILGGLAFAWWKFYYAFDDKIVLVDENGKPTGTASKLEAHNSDTKLHRAFSVFVFNGRGELLLQQRALSKKTWPGVWSNSCCGHVMMHERTEDAATRRLKFELGLSDVDLQMTLPDFRYRAERDGVVENEICPVLVGFTERTPVINPSEVADTRWVEWNQFLGSLDDPAHEISPWAIKEVRLLAESDSFKRWFARRVKVSGAPSSI